MKFPIHYNKKNMFILVLILIFLVFSLLFFSFKKTIISIITATDTLVLDVAIADTPEKQMKGLMFKKQLAEYEGMLFVFDKPDKRHFWMKNTYLPLDIIFIDDKGRIVQIEHAYPCTIDPCMIYSSTASTIQYVLETNQNFTEENGITIGDLVSIN